MKFMAKNFITILSLLVTIIVSITAYAYRSDLENLDKKINTEKEERVKVCNALKEDINGKVSKDAFEEFKSGHEKIMNYINQSNNQIRIYQEIIKELTFINIDTNLVKNNKLYANENNN